MCQALVGALFQKYFVLNRWQGAQEGIDDGFVATGNQAGMQEMLPKPMEIYSQKSAPSRLSIKLLGPFLCRLPETEAVTKFDAYPY